MIVHGCPAISMQREGVSNSTTQWFTCDDPLRDVTYLVVQVNEPWHLMDRWCVSQALLARRAAVTAPTTAYSASQQQGKT